MPEHHRPTLEVLRLLARQCRFLLPDRAAFDDQYLAALGGALPAEHPLRAEPDLALELVDVVLHAVLSGQPLGDTEAECHQFGERCAAAGLPDDSFNGMGRALAWAARESAGEAWTSAMSSGWVAVQLWVIPQLIGGPPTPVPAMRCGIPSRSWSPPGPLRRVRLGRRG